MSIDIDFIEILAFGLLHIKQRKVTESALVKNIFLNIFRTSLGSYKSPILVFYNLWQVWQTFKKFQPDFPYSIICTETFSFVLR